MRVVQVLRGERSMIPAPLTYLVVLAAGAIVGVLLDLATGWRWWLVPLVAMAATWLFFMSSAVWGRHRSRSLGESILMVLAPRRAAERMDHETEESLRSLPFPLYGLPPTWRGVRFIAGHGRSGRVITSASLGHADGSPFDPEVSELRVEVSPAAEHASPHGDRLTHWLAHASAPDLPLDASPEEMAIWHLQIERDARALMQEAWRDLEVSVDGVPRAFRLLEREQAWTARGRIGDHDVRFEARRFAHARLELVTVTDVEPYIDGGRKLREENARRHEQNR